MDILARHAQNRDKQLACFTQLQGMSIVPKSKMFKFYKNVSAAFTELDKEMVECRRMSKITTRYESLERKYYECITVFEQWSLMAVLTY